MTDSHQQLLRNTLANINRITREASPDANSSDENDEFEDWVKGTIPVEYPEIWNRMRPRALMQNQQTGELISTWNTQHKYNNKVLSHLW